MTKYSIYDGFTGFSCDYNVKQLFSIFLFHHTSEHSQPQLFETRPIIPFKLLEKFQQVRGIFMFQSSYCDLQATSLFLSLEEFSRRFVTLHFLVIFSFFRFSLTYLQWRLSAVCSVLQNLKPCIGCYPAGSSGPSCIRQVLDCISNDVLHQWEILEHEPLLCCTGPLKTTQGLRAPHTQYISIVWNWKTRQVIH